MCAKKLEGPRVAIVTGASRGLGRAISIRLAADGHHVVLMSRSEDVLNALRDSIEADGGSASVVTCDVMDAKALADAVVSVSKDLGRLDILVNNAGVLRDTLMLRMTDEMFDEIISIHLKAVFVASRSAVRPMMSGRFGRIITIGSVTGIVGRPGQANYSAAKAGVIGLSKTIAREFATKGITANVVAPGFIETDMTADIPEGMREEAKGLTPMRRFGQPDDVAACVSFLASDEAGYITGETIRVDGGMAI